MCLFTKQQQTHVLKEEAYGYKGGEGGEKG